MGEARRNVCVAAIPHHWTPDMLSDAFARFGAVASSRILYHGSATHEGFVLFAEPAAAAAAAAQGWARFGAVHSQWRDQLDIRSNGTFSRVSRDDGGSWAAGRWNGDVGEITINWANWDVSDTFHTTDGGASWAAVGRNQWGDEYQVSLKVSINDEFFI